MFGLIVDNIGGWEILAVLVLLMVVVGPDRLPEMARKIGRGIAQARAQMSSMSDEVRGVVDDPAMQPLREIGEFAMRPRQKLSEIVRMAEFDLHEEAAQVKALLDAPVQPEASPTIADLPEPGLPPGNGPQYPATMDDKLGGRRVPVDSEVAAQRRLDAGVPDNAAFTTRAAPLGASAPEGVPGRVAEQEGPPTSMSTPVASTAFTARGGPLGQRIEPAEDDQASANPSALADTAEPDRPDGPTS